MRAEFRSSFAKDLRGIRDKELLKRIGESIEQVERAQTLRELPNLKKLKGAGKY